MATPLRFRVVPGRWAVCRLDPDAAIPAWAAHGIFTSVTRTPQELSIVCPEESAPAGVTVQKDWACFQLIGPFDFALTGILASFVQPLAEAKVPIFALSTYDTDWVLLPAGKQPEALRALAAAGHVEISA